MLKLGIWEGINNPVFQPPSGGCVLKHRRGVSVHIVARQPPSGGCVLKLQTGGRLAPLLRPAAFGRLCVETLPDALPRLLRSPSRLRAAVC